MRNLPSYSQWKLNESGSNPFGIFPKNELDYVRKNEKDPTPNTYDSRMVSESLSPSWKSYAIGSEFVHGKLKFFHFKEGKHLVLTVMDGKYPEAWSIYYWNHGKPVGTDAVSRVVAATAARFDKGGDLDDGWTLGNDEPKLVARWESRGGKYAVDLYHRGGPSYDYEGNGSSGSFLAQSLEDAIQWMEKHGPTSQPGRKGPETKMKRTK